MFMVDQELPVSENEDQKNLEVVAETEAQQNANSPAVVESELQKTEEVVPQDEVSEVEVSESSPNVSDEVSEVEVSESSPNVSDEAVVSHTTVATSVVTEEVKEVPVISPVEQQIDSNNSDIPHFAAGKTSPTVELSPEQKAEAEAVAAAKKAQKREHEKKRREEQQKKHQVVFDELEQLHKENAAIDVVIIARVKGGLRCTYKALPMFLPVSHFQNISNPTEDDLMGTINKTISVNIHEIGKDDQGRFAVVVSRRKLLKAQRWAELSVNDIVDGTISSVVSFGLFVNIDGIEGLVHISRLSNTRIDDITKVYKQGQKIKAVITSINNDTHKISLSTKELEASPYVGVTEKLSVGTKTKGTIVSITSFGAYIELLPGIQGLLRNGDYSWTQRVRNLGELTAIGSEIDVIILDISEEKQQLSLGVKQLFSNPWDSITEQFDKESTYSVVVKKAINQGFIVELTDQIDAFIPKSKLVQATAKTLAVGDSLAVNILEIDPKNSSIVLSQEGYVPSTNYSSDRPKRQDNDRGGDRNDRSSNYKGKSQSYSNHGYDSSGGNDSKEQSSVTLFDMLDEKQKNKINKLTE